MVYGLTKGQASPTSQPGFKTSVQVDGVILGQFNPLAVALSLDASFVARAFIGDMEQTKEIIKKAVTHKGFALVDIFQPCVTFNKINSFQWFKANTYYLESTYDPHDRVHVFQRALEAEKLPLGVFYINSGKPVFEDQITIYRKSTVPLIKRAVNREALSGFIDKKRGMPVASVSAKVL
jgi:2-oxoglutarate ferredoxin oxidoreductase subunit beta